MKSIMDLEFSRQGGCVLQIDLLLPDQADPPALVVVIHGGGWREGSRKDEGLEWLVNEGFAVARIEYRLSHDAIYPAQREDCLMALEWLRSRHQKFGYANSPPFVIGTSAGGTLALLLATKGLARATVAYCAPCDFLLRAKSQPHLTDHPRGTVHDLLGGPVSENLVLAREASPAYQVTKACSPVLLIHGGEDRQVPAEQPLFFLRAGLEAGADISLLTVPNAAHCGSRYHEDSVRSQVIAFLRRFLS